MRVPKHAPQLLAIQHLMHLGRIRAVARSRELLLAEPALAATDTEAVDHAVADLAVFDRAAHGLDHATELVAQDVAFFQLQDHLVQQMHVAAAYSATCYADQDVARLDERGLADLRCGGKVGGGIVEGGK